MKTLRYIAVTIAALLSSLTVYSQVYNDGRESASVKYEQIKAPTYTLVYPVGFRPEAFRVSQFVDSVAPYVAYGFKSPYRKFPIILYTSNQHSNGLVSFLPAREEMIMTPPVSMTAMPWMKQLAIHEYRHVAQMSALYSNVFGYGRWFLGELSNCVGLAFVAKWYLEGDATNAETQLAEFGRGLQPDFTIEYRAMMTEEAERPFDKWYMDNLTLGSFRYNVPDLYHFGYQMVRSMETRLSPTYIGDFFDYVSRRPYTISPSYFFMKKHSGSDMRTFFKSTFRELDSIWKPTLAVKDSYRYLTRSGRSYTQYSYPLSLGNGSIVALKRTMDDPTAFVMTSGGSARRLFNPGSISSRPVLRDSVVYWTEYKPSVFYEYKNSSIIRSYDIRSGRRHGYRKGESSYLVTPIPQGWAMVRYDSLLHGAVYIADSSFRDTDTVKFSANTSFHGLAYDEVTSTLGFIAVDDRGMWIGGIDASGKVSVLRDPSAVTLSDLSAGGGKLYFGSIQSGKDEIHALDIETGTESRLTSSRLGARQPSPDGDSVLFTGYSVKGWNIAKASSSAPDSMTVQWQRLPDDILNPKRVQWTGARAFDTVSVGSSVAPEKKVKRFHRVSKWMNIHSWVPGLAVELDKFLDEYSIEAGVGATALFQSPLGDFMGYMTAGNKNSKFWGVASIDYTGLPVVFGAKAEYGGGSNRSYYTEGMEYSEEKYGDPGYYARVDANVSLPLNISSYSTTRKITPVFNYTRTADRIYDEDYDSFVSGLDMWEANVTYSALKTYSQRSLSPRLGAVVRFGMKGALRYDFGEIKYAKGTFYLPGIMKNHSIILSASAQYQNLSKYNFMTKVMTPTGISDDNIYQKYGCVKANYEFPVFYPEFGIDRYVFFRRLAAQLFCDYSYGAFTKETGYPSVINHSYGLGIGVDMSFFSTGNQYFLFKLAFPNSKSTFLGFTFSIDL